MQQLNAHLHSKNKPPYILNLDPAVRNLPYEANIDIRDTINYKEVMKQYVCLFQSYKISGNFLIHLDITWGQMAVL